MYVGVGGGGGADDFTNFPKNVDIPGDHGPKYFMA